MRLNNSSTPGLHGAEAGRDASTKACGDLLFSSTAPLFRTESLLEPRHHQPHVFVLLSAHAARAAIAA